MKIFTQHLGGILRKDGRKAFVEVRHVIDKDGRYVHRAGGPEAILAGDYGPGTGMLKRLEMSGKRSICSGTIRARWVDA